jgi:hypothetical protein
MASAILIDVAEPSGLIQLETRAYKASYLESFGFEVGAGSEFYSVLRIGCERLVEDGLVARVTSGESEEAS